MKQDQHKYARDHLDEVIKRLRENRVEFDRIKSSLGRFARTLERDLDGAWEKRVPGRRIDSDYMHAVCNAFLNRFTSSIYNSIINTITDDVGSQRPLANLLGKYRAFWPSGQLNSFSTFPMEISETDGMFAVSSVTGDHEFKYSHFGHAFLVRKRVHVVDIRTGGIRTMLFHYEEVPARNPIKGIITNILHADDNARNGEQLFSVHFVAFHEKDPRFHGSVPNEEIARVLHHDLNRIGVVRV